MKKVILTKIEYEFLIECLEKLDTTQRLYELEMEYYKIKKYGEPSTKYDMVRWLLTKVKNKTLDF